MIDPDDKYLLIYRDDHPVFGNDPDLPGGTLENDETVFEAMLREAKEELGIIIDEKSTKQLYSGFEYSRHDTHYTLFVSNVKKRPLIVMSWEHSSYEWLDREDFLERAKSAKDTYMHMVHDVLK